MSPRVSLTARRLGGGCLGNILWPPTNLDNLRAQWPEWSVVSCGRRRSATSPWGPPTRGRVQGGRGGPPGEADLWWSVTGGRWYVVLWQAHDGPARPVQPARRGERRQQAEDPQQLPALRPQHRGPAQSQGEVWGGHDKSNLGWMFRCFVANTAALGTTCSWLPAKTVK